MRPNDVGLKLVSVHRAYILTSWAATIFIVLLAITLVKNNWLQFFDSLAAGVLATAAAFVIYYIYSGFTGFGTKLKESPLDAWFPFIPHFIVIYVSYFIFMPITAGGILVRSELFAMFGNVACAYIAASLTYIVRPTHVVRPRLSDYHMPFFIRRMHLVIRACDSGKNALPSMHVVVTLLVVFWSYPHPLFGLIALWGLLIVVSTLLTKQHVFIDVLTAFVYSFVLYMPYRLFAEERVAPWLHYLAALIP